MEELIAIAEMEFFAFTIPVLLAFALIYGILSKTNTPESNSSRTVIALVLSLFIIPVSGPVMNFLTHFGNSFLIISVVLLFFIILVEMTGGSEEITGHSRSFGALIILIAVIIFTGAGGFEMIGLETVVSQIDATTITFLAVMSLAIYWMVISSD